MMRLPSTGWEKMSTFLEIYLICIINACSHGFLVACEHLWHAWNALVRLFQRIYQAPYPPLRPSHGTHHAIPSMPSPHPMESQVHAQCYPTVLRTHV